MRSVVLTATCAIAMACGGKTPNDSAVVPDDGDTASGLGFVDKSVEASSSETDLHVLTSSLAGASAPRHGKLEKDKPGGRGKGDGPVALFFPRGCLTVEDDRGSDSAVYRFQDCAGPSGLRRITGEIRVDRTETETGVDLTFSADSLSVNRATLDLSAKASIVIEGRTRTMTWIGQVSGETGNGRPLERSVARTVTWSLGDPCVTLNGRSEGTIGSHNVVTEASNIARCRGDCPEPGGTITITHAARNERYTVTFDGGTEASVTGPTDTFRLPLRCNR